jgi:hypothetical protein
MNKNERNLTEIIEAEGLIKTLKHKAEKKDDTGAAKEQKFMPNVKFDMMLAKIYLAL